MPLVCGEQFHCKDGRAVLHYGDCVSVLPSLPSGSFDLVLTDPPYPCIKRQYGTWTEEEWWRLMRAVVPECMRVLKPTGSAVFILQPNSERVGRMRTWLWEFITWVGKEWGIVQDAYWWNIAASPVTNGTHKGQGNLLRSSLKVCAWVGPSNCYRDQSRVLWSESMRTKILRTTGRVTRERPSGWRGKSKPIFDQDNRLDVSVERGGVTPFNVIPMGAGKAGGVMGHTGATPIQLANWWTRYLCPPGGRVLDPFAGSGTVGLAALAHGATFLGIEKEGEYVQISRRRLEDAP